MIKTFKSFICIIPLLFLAFLFSTNVYADKDAEGAYEYDPNVKGWVRVEVKVPEGFNEIVFFEVMDASGAPSAYQVLPINGYVFEQQMTAGPYLVNAYVHNDNLLKYSVSKSVDKITVAEEEDAVVVFTISGGPEEQPTPSSSAEATEFPSLLGDDEPETDSTSPSPSPSPEAVETEDPVEVTPIVDEVVDEEPEEMSFWKRALIAVTGTAVFVGIVFGIVYIARRYMKLHD